MAMILEQRAQLLQSLGSIATSAADAAAEGIAEAARTDSKTVDTALKLFGGFDRTEFENINGQAPNLLVPAVRPPASYEAPAEYFKPLSNTMADQGFLVKSKDLLQQLEDPRFRMADGLSGFSDNRITQSLMQNGISMGPDENGMASLDAFGKLYEMENTVAKQLQLHEQLDFGAFANLSAPRQNPRLDRGLKGMPDAQIATQPNDEILNLWEHAMTGIPKTVGEFFQILDTLYAKTQGILNGTDNPKIKEACLGFCQKLSYVKTMFKHVPQQSALPDAMRNYLSPLRAAMANLIYVADSYA